MMHGVRKCTLFVHPIPMMTCNKVGASLRGGVVTPLSNSTPHASKKNLF